MVREWKIASWRAKKYSDFKNVEVFYKIRQIGTLAFKRDDGFSIYGVGVRKDVRKGGGRVVSRGELIWVGVISNRKKELTFLI